MRRTIFVLLVGLLPIPITAQTEMIRGSGGISISAEFLLVNYKEPIPGFKASGFAGILSGVIPVAEGYAAEVEIPYVQTKTEFSNPFGSSSSTENSLANIYIGLTMGSRGNLVSGQLGVRLPTLPESKAGAGLAGVTGDFPHYERYLSNLLSVSGGVNLRTPIGPSFDLMGRVIPSVWFPTKGQGRQTELLVYYGIAPAASFAIVEVSVGVNGLLLVTEDRFLGQKSTLHHLQIEANATFGIVQPGIMLRIPLEKELDGTISNTIGFYASVNL